MRMTENALKRILKHAVIGMLCVAGMAWAQPMSNEMAQGIYDAEVRKRRAQQQQGASRGPSAAEVRAWHERERKIQAEIAQHRATPYWMAIAQDWGGKRTIWPGGYTSEQRAIEEAKRSCRSGNCELLATFANSCAVIVAATPTPMNKADFFIGIDPDDRKAAAKAWQACQAVHGNRQDRCFYSQAKTGKGIDGTAFCVGYDHSVYGQH